MDEVLHRPTTWRVCHRWPCALQSWTCWLSATDENRRNGIDLTCCTACAGHHPPRRGRELKAQTQSLVYCSCCQPRIQPLSQLMLSYRISISASPTSFEGRSLRASGPLFVSSKCRLKSKHCFEQPAGWLDFIVLPSSWPSARS
jgi:hypothetical protein